MKARLTLLCAATFLLAASCTWEHDVFVYNPCDEDLVIEWSGRYHHDAPVTVAAFTPSEYRSAIVPAKSWIQAGWLDGYSDYDLHVLMVKDKNYIGVIRVAQLELANWHRTLPASICNT